MTEKEYRDLDIDSYSTIKLFLDDRKKYYKKYVLKEVVKDDKTPYTIFGDLVDCLLTKPEEYEERFCLSVSQLPTGQYGKLVDELMKCTIACLNDEGEVTKDLEDLLLEAYNRVKFDRDGSIVDFKRDSFETAKTKFIGSDLENHYRQMREAYGKTIIEIGTLENAQALIETLKSNFVTRDIINMKTEGNMEVYNQFPIVGEMPANLFTELPNVKAFPLKCLLDKLIIDHEQCRIYIYDLKTAWDNEGEFLQNYFKYRYYIQMAIYFFLVVEWKKKQPKLANYAVHYPYFIVAESSNYKNPLIYSTSSENFNQGMRGFVIRGRYYPGVIKAIQDLIWHKEEGIWTMSVDNFKNLGIVRVKPFE